MGYYFRLARICAGRQSESPRQRKIYKRRIKASAGKLVLSTKALSYTFVCLIGLLGFFYLTLVNIRATKGFEIKHLEKKIVELEKDQKELEKSAAELQSINSIEGKINLSEFVPTTDITYINSSDYAVSSDITNNP